MPARKGYADACNRTHTFDALIRFSAGNVEVQEDTVPQAAGMAIKLLGVDGEKLLENEKAMSSCMRTWPRAN